jgi:hypothetical protein
MWFKGTASRELNALKLLLLDLYELCGKLICFASFEFGTSLGNVSRGYQIPPGTSRMYSMLSDKFPREYRQTTCWKWCIDKLFRQMIAINAGIFASGYLPIATRIGP